MDQSNASHDCYNSATTVSNSKLLDQQTAWLVKCCSDCFWHVTIYKYPTWQLFAFLKGDSVSGLPCMQVILSNHRSDILDSTKDAGMIWVSIHRTLKWLKACSTFYHHIERHQAKMIAKMPEAHTAKVSFMSHCVSKIFLILCFSYEYGKTLT